MSQVEGNTSLEGSYVGAGATSLTSGSGNTDLDKDAFLTLLITQFQYQDPLNPMEDKEFIAQLAQFSALEQSMAMNESMQEMIISTNQQTTISITSYIGLEVSARGIGLSKDETGISKVQYASAETMSECYVNILDANNAVVATVQIGAKAAGIHDFTWDGKKSNGTEAEDGVYQVAFSGKNEAGEAVTLDTSIAGRVTGTSFYDGQYYLRMEDGRSVLLNNVYEVVEAPPKTEEDDTILPENIDGTDGDDYLAGGKGADTIKAGKGNDIIIYDPTDELVDGGEGYDFLIAPGEIGENAKNYEAVIRGDDAMTIKSMQNLVDMGLTFKPDGSEIDTTSPFWTANWEDKGKGQWTYTRDDDGDKEVDREITIEIQSQITSETPDADTETPETGTKTSRSATRSAPQMASQAVSQAAAPMAASQASTPNFSEALRTGMNSAVDSTSQSLSNNASSTISRFMKAMNV